MGRSSGTIAVYSAPRQVQWTAGLSSCSALPIIGDATPSNGVWRLRRALCHQDYFQIPPALQRVYWCSRRLGVWRLKELFRLSASPLQAFLAILQLMALDGRLFPAPIYW